MQIHIERRHTVGKQEAIRRLDTDLDSKISGLLGGSLPKGVTVKEISKSWSDNVMHGIISVKAGLGIIGYNGKIPANIRVNDDSLVVDLGPENPLLPILISRMLPTESRIRDEVNKWLDGLFPA